MDYLTNGIPWSVVQKMMIDAPSYDYDGKDEEDIKELTDDNAEEIKNYINSLII